MANKGSTKPTYEERTFPIQRGAPIPWAIAEVAYRTYAAHYSGQSLERLAERGGFGWHEFLHLYFGDIDWKLTDAQVEERWKSDKEQQLTAELARVRGLLQRGYHLVNVAGSCADESEEVGDKWMEEVESELKIGAESTDIGKLETVDDLVPIKSVDRTEESTRHRHWTGAETGVGTGKVNRVDEAPSGSAAYHQEHIEMQRRIKNQRQQLAKAYKDLEEKNRRIEYLEPFRQQVQGIAGSAETGGEKDAHLPNLSDHCDDCGRVRAKHGYGALGYNAASNCMLDDCDCPWWLEPTFPRPSQNQTVSSGVEGAHEGTTADKSESREPEKLNNAQKSVELRAIADRICSEAHSGWRVELSPAGRAWLSNAIFHELEALAESSLSSPPKERRKSD